MTRKSVETKNRSDLGWLGRREPVSIRVLPPIETSGLTTADIPELMARCHREMEAAISAMS